MLYGPSQWAVGETVELMLVVPLVVEFSAGAFSSVILTVAHASADAAHVPTAAELGERIGALEWPVKPV